MIIHEPAKETPIKISCDVAVAGGGIAGISAALSAARNGANVVLLEREYALGGLATLGLVTIYLPLCDGKGTQVSFGISEELLRLSIKHGMEPSSSIDEKSLMAWLNGGPQEEKKATRFKAQFNAAIFAILCEKLLLDAGVQILYGCHVCDAVTENSKIKALIIEEKDGRKAIVAKSYVDCTGDADLCTRSGAETAVFQQGNILASWYYCHNKSNYDLHMLGFSDTPDKYKLPKERTQKQTRYHGLDGRDLSSMSIAAHSSILNNFLQGGGITSEHAIASIATIPQVRMTRRIVGEYEINDSELHKSFADSIGMICDWRKAGPVYELPFRSLYSKKVKNLITAGRCISATDDMWDITRVIPACAVTGEAAGLAAAMTDDFPAIHISALQQCLKNQGVVLHEEDLSLNA